jgi:hypothetical protein
MGLENELSLFIDHFKEVIECRPLLQTFNQLEEENLDLREKLERN